MGKKTITVNVEEHHHDLVEQIYYTFSIIVNGRLEYEGGPNREEATKRIIENAIKEIMSDLK